MADEKAAKMLQMPPVKYPAEHRPKVLDQDPALQGFLDPSVKVILVDATPGYSDVVSVFGSKRRESSYLHSKFPPPHSHQERLIVVREADGTLREATREERHRSNQIFYPVEERSIELPKMLEDPHIEVGRSNLTTFIIISCSKFSFYFAPLFSRPSSTAPPTSCS